MVGSPAFVYYFTTTMSTPFLLTFVACFQLLGAEIARYFTYGEPRGVGWVLVGYAIALVVVLWASVCPALPAAPPGISDGEGLGE